MSIPNTTINSADFTTISSIPPRWKFNADYMVNSDPAQLALLNTNDEAYYTYVNANVGAFYAPVPIAALIAKNVGVNVQLFLTSYTVYQPVEWYYTLSTIIAYNGTPPTAPTSATTSFASSGVFGVTGTIANAGFVAGSDVVIAIQAASLGAPVSPTEYSLPVLTFEAIFAPAAPTAIGATSATGHSVVSWTNSSGGASYTIYWKSGSLSYTAAQILAAPTGSVAGTVPAGQTVTLTAGTYSFTVTATNPGGTSAGGTAASATVS
jgi:hypothetical protein